MYDDRNARMHIKQFCKYLNESDLNIRELKIHTTVNIRHIGYYCKIYTSLAPFMSSVEANDI
jgi:effector-binding domain-containing protein